MPSPVVVGYEFVNVVTTLTNGVEEVVYRSRGMTDLVEGATNAFIEVEEQPLEIVVVGDTWWARDDEEWKPTSSDELSWRFLFFAPLTPEDMSGLTTGPGKSSQLIGEESLLGLSVRHERLDTELIFGFDPTAEPEEASIDRWVTDQGVVLRLEFRLGDDPGGGWLMSLWEVVSVNPPIEISIPPSDDGPATDR
ncbi:MAG: hypothetical protein WD651_04475 [Acidimicrobiia bacterium]